MDVRSRDMTELIVCEEDVVWVRTHLIPPEVMCKLGIIMAALAAAAGSCSGLGS